jgi:hypothetical protein
MANTKAEFELSDKEGTTAIYAGAVGTSAIAIPTVADKFIDEISIRCAIDQANNKRLEFSFDNSVFHRLAVGEMREEEPRGTIKQIWIRAAGSGVTTVNYEIAINYGRLS